MVATSQPEEVRSSARDLDGQAQELAAALEAYASSAYARRQLALDFMGCIIKAIRVSMTVVYDVPVPWHHDYFALDSPYADWKTREQDRGWTELQTRIPRLSVPLCLGTLAMAESVLVWLQQVQERHLIGETAWESLTTGSYSYDLYKYQASLLGLRLLDSRVEHDASRREGERNWYVQDTTTRVRRQLVREHHVHHITDAKIHRLDEYHRPLPSRALRFLKIVPPRLAPLFLLVTGTIVQEDKDVYTVTDNTVIESGSHIVSKRSPAIIFGSFVLIGWSSDDVSLGNKVSWLFRGRRSPIRRQ